MTPRAASRATTAKVRFIGEESPGRADGWNATIRSFARSKERTIVGPSPAGAPHNLHP